MSIEAELALQYLTEIDALKAEVARLREREAQLEQMLKGGGWREKAGYWEKVEASHSDVTEAAEARVARLEEALAKVPLWKLTDEEAQAVESTYRALAHEEEK